MTKIASLGMAPMRSTEIDAQQRKLLLELAAAVVKKAASQGKRTTVNIADYSDVLLEQRACFVTLTINHLLRGCIGSLRAVEPLVASVAHNAYAAAMTDPRFPAVTSNELNALSYEISVLTPPEPMPVENEEQLLRDIRPGIDGVILEGEGCGATYLPSVWEQLPEPGEFIRQLKLKAGLPADYWSSSMTIQRYGTESFSS